MPIYYILLVLCGALCVAALLIAGRTIRLTLWKKLVVTLVSFVVAYFGVHLMSWIESGSFSGRSFFGAYFIGPVCAFLLCLLLRVPRESRSDLLDLSGPCIVLTMGILKLACYIQGCCRGRVLWTAANGDPVRFPSQLAECAFCVILAAVLLYLIWRGRHRGRVLIYTYIAYGVGRFLLNFLRDVQPFHGMLPSGNLWALLSVLIGVTALYVSYLRRVNAQQKRAAHRH